jgi:uncharacterized protein (UPF0147 family)
VINIKTERAKQLLEEACGDRGIPKNIKNSMEECLKILSDTKEAENVRLSTAISILDEASADPNISLYGRTKIWNVISQLEYLNK